MDKASKSQMEELDRILVDDFGFSVEALMENSGYQVADFIRQEFSRDIKIAVICGKGFNGGDGFVVARRLAAWGFEVEAYTPFDSLPGLAEEKFEALKSMDESFVSHDFPSANIYVDALLGYGIEGEVRSPVLEAVEKINEWSAETVSIDVPTGLDIEKEKIHGDAVNPDYTVTLGLLKQGMAENNSGEIFIADIGVPPQALEKVGLEASEIFASSSLVSLEDLR